MLAPPLSVRITNQILVDVAFADPCLGKPGEERQGCNLAQGWYQAGELQLFLPLANNQQPTATSTLTSPLP